MESKLFTVVEVAEILRVQKSTVYDWVHFGKIGHSKCGGLRFTMTDIETFIQANSRAAKVSKPKKPGQRRRSCRVPADTLAIIEQAKAEVLQSSEGGSCAGKGLN